jgi:hypothetical protein
MDGSSARAKTYRWDAPIRDLQVVLGHMSLTTTEHYLAESNPKHPHIRASPTRRLASNYGKTFRYTAPPIQLGLAVSQFRAASTVCLMYG